MGNKTDKIIGGFCALIQGSLTSTAAVLATADKPIPLWIPIVMGVVGAATAVVKVGWFGGGS